MTKRNISIVVVASIITVLAVLSQQPAPTTPHTQATTTQTTSISKSGLFSAPTHKRSSSATANSVIISVAHRGTVLDAMHSATAHGDFSFEGKEYPSLGYFVESINGTKSADGFYWFLYINDTSSPLGASSALVQVGDVVEWRYKTSE